MMQNESPNDMVILPGGAMVPRKIAERGDRGWGSDDDRDSRDLSRLAELYARMDREVHLWLNTSNGGDVETMCAMWLEIREITRGAP